MIEFNWNVPARGAMINSFLDMLCKDHPQVAECVASRKFGDLGSWFDKDDWKTAECGCLIGNIALCTTKQNDLYQQIDDVMTALDFRVFSDASVVAYIALRIVSGKVPKQVATTYSGSNTIEFLIEDDFGALMHDSLFDWIFDVGMAVSHESEMDDDTVNEEDCEARKEELKDYLHESIKFRLQQAA